MGGGGRPKVANVSAGGMPSGIFHVIMLLPGGGVGGDSRHPPPHTHTQKT